MDAHGQAQGAEVRPITIAVVALGGEGGGVLADWIVDLAQHGGYLAQATSVPGVAQRTGATVYYVELFPKAQADAREPVLALMPVPGDVDVVIASELMEAGRAVQRLQRTGHAADALEVHPFQEQLAALQHHAGRARRAQDGDVERAVPGHVDAGRKDLPVGQDERDVARNGWALDGHWSTTPGERHRTADL